MATKISDKTAVDAIPSAEWNWLVDLTDSTGVASANLKWAQTTTTGTALEVTRDLAAASTDSPVAYLLQDNAGDDQPVLRIGQDGTVEAIDFSSGTIAFDFAAAMSGVGAGAMAVNNSPGAGTTTWITVEVNGVTGYIPVHYAV